VSGVGWSCTIHLNVIVLKSASVSQVAPFLRVYARTWYDFPMKPGTGIMEGRQISLHLPESLRIRLDQHAAATDRPMSRIVREAISEYLAAQAPEATDD
jgi:hypothetical protein